MNAETTTEKRKFSPATAARVDACAYIFMSDKPAKINAIATARGIEPIEAARIYTLGAIKRSVAQGIARNFAEALELLEDRQAGDCGNPLTRTTGAEKTARYIARINALNAGKAPTKTSPGNPDYFLSTDNGATYTPVYPQPKETKTRPGYNIGKALGSLYTEWQDKETDADPARVYADKERAVVESQLDKHLRLYFSDYKNRLSKTSARRLAELANSPLPAGYIISYADKSADIKERGLKQAAARLYDKFPKKDAITESEFIDLVKAYC